MRSFSPKIILIQLPLQETGEVYVVENISLAAGYLLCALKEAGLDHLVEAKMLSQNLLDSGGDARIIDAVASEQPDLVGFSCYCWNVERSLYLAEKIKEKSPGTLILLGGPEIVKKDSPALNSPVYDMAVVGEGEKPFGEIVHRLLQGKMDFVGIGQVVVNAQQGSPSLPDILAEGMLPKLNPYLEGYLSPSAEGTVFVETVRGCGFSCSYCYYPKNFSSIRSFPLSLIRDIFLYARNAQAKEICFLDPSFNTNPNFRKICRILADVNRDKTLAVHAELRPDFLSQEDVDLLADANLKSVELGLQSVHPETLKILRRPCNLDRWIRGVEMLRDRGISVRCDLILGLPEEDLAKMSESIDFLTKIGCGEDAQIFHLNLLPGTDLRENAQRYGIRHQKSPPYMVIETSKASQSDLAHALFYAQESFGIEISPSEGGPFLFPTRKDGEIHCFEDCLANPILLDEKIHNCRRDVSNRLRIWFHARDLDVFKEAIVGFVGGIHRDNPYTLLEIILESEVPFSPDLVQKIFKYGSFFTHYINKSHYYIDQKGLRSTRLTALFPLKAVNHPLFDGLRDLVAVYFSMPPDLPAISPEMVNVAEGFFIDLQDNQNSWSDLVKRYGDLPLFFRSPNHYKMWKDFL